MTTMMTILIPNDPNSARVETLEIQEDIEEEDGDGSFGRLG